MPPLPSRAAASLLLLVATAAPCASAAEWNPAAYATADTIELRTVGPEEGEHRFPVWLVVIDDQVYIRLGSPAATRVEKNTTAPYLGVKILGQEFNRVKGIPAPDDAERVAQAMRAKYWTDVFVRYMSHPLTLRLVPAEDIGKPRP